MTAHWWFAYAYGFATGLALVITASGIWGLYQLQKTRPARAIAVAIAKDNADG